MAFTHAIVLGGFVHQLLTENIVVAEGIEVIDVSAYPGVAEGWVVNPDRSVSAPAIAPPSVANLVAYAATCRFAVEVAGVTVNGLRVATDRGSQSMVANALAGMQASGATTVKFKAASGWIELSVDQLKAVALAVFAHVQACFAAEDACDAGINASPPTVATFADVEAAFAPLAS